MRCGHIGLTCADLGRSEKFYRDLFGFETFFRIRRNTPWLAAQVGYPDADIEFCHMRGCDGLHLELLKYHYPTLDRYGPTQGFHLPDDTYIPGNVHINIWVEDALDMIEDIAEWLYKNDNIGLARIAPNPLGIEASTVPDGPNAGSKGFYLRDPDGHSIEIIQPAVWPSSNLDKEIASVIDRLEAARARQNTNWMDVVRTIYRVAPEEGHRLFKKIEEQDREINAIAAESHK